MDSSQSTADAHYPGSGPRGIKRHNDQEDLVKQKRYRYAPSDYTQRDSPYGNNALTGSHTNELKEQECHLQNMKNSLQQWQQITDAPPDRRTLHPTLKKPAPFPGYNAVMHNVSRPYDPHASRPASRPGGGYTAPCGPYHPAAQLMVNSGRYAHAVPATVTGNKQPPQVNAFANYAGNSGPMPGPAPHQHTQNVQRGYIGTPVCNKAQTTSAGFPTSARLSKPQPQAQREQPVYHPQQAQGLRTAQLGSPSNILPQDIGVKQVAAPVKLQSTEEPKFVGHIPPADVEDLHCLPSDKAYPRWLCWWLMRARKQIKPQSVVKDVPGIPTNYDHPMTEWGAPPNVPYTPLEIFNLRSLSPGGRVMYYMKFLKATMQAVNALGTPDFYGIWTWLLNGSNQLRAKERACYEAYQKAGILNQLIQAQARPFSFEEAKAELQQRQNGQSATKPLPREPPHIDPALLGQKIASTKSGIVDLQQHAVDGQAQVKPISEQRSQPDVVDLTNDEDQVVYAHAEQHPSIVPTHGSNTQLTADHAAHIQSHEIYDASATVSPRNNSPQSVFDHTEKIGESPSYLTNPSSPEASDGSGITGARVVLGSDGPAEELNPGVKRCAPDDRENEHPNEPVNKKLRRDEAELRQITVAAAQYAIPLNYVDLTGPNPTEARRSPKRLDESKFADYRKFMEAEKSRSVPDARATGTQAAIDQAIGGGSVSDKAWLRFGRHQEKKQAPKPGPKAAMPPGFEPKPQEHRPNLPDEPDLDLSKYTRLEGDPDRFHCGKTHKPGNECKDCEPGLSERAKITQIRKLWAKEWSETNDKREEMGMEPCYPKGQFNLACASKATQQRKKKEQKAREERERIEKAEKAEKLQREAEEKRLAIEKEERWAKWEADQKKEKEEREAKRRALEARRKAKAEEESRRRIEAAAQREIEAQQEAEIRRKEEEEAKAKEQAVAAQENAAGTEDDEWDEELFGDQFPG